jgi:hypothetical protein
MKQKLRIIGVLAELEQGLLPPPKAPVVDEDVTRASRQM